MVLILAAGRSERFRAAGGTSDKLDAPLTTASGTRSVLEHVIAAAQASGLPWHVVRAADTAHHAEQGMDTSIATGVTATPDASGWLVLPGDRPLVQPQSLRAVAAVLSDHTVVLPMVNGQRGHPVGFGRACREALLGLRGEQGARGVAEAHAAQLSVGRCGLHAGCGYAGVVAAGAGYGWRLKASNRQPWQMTGSPKPVIYFEQH